MTGRWPRSLAEVSIHPEHAAPEWAMHIQGVAITDDWWFISQADRLWRFPIEADLTQIDPDANGVRSVGFPREGVDHFGDCDAVDGHVYLAMEGTDPALIGVFDADLHFVASAPVDPQGLSNPWCAVDPVTGLLYSSPFDTDHLDAYEHHLDHGRFELRHTRSVTLRTADGDPIALRRVQGGSFTPDGRLYLTGDTRHGGIFGVDVASGARILHRKISYERGWPERHIIEGLAYCIRDGCSPAPGMTGHLHVLVYDATKDSPDYLWFRHYDERH